MIPDFLRGGDRGGSMPKTPKSLPTSFPATPAQRFSKQLTNKEK